MRRENPIRMTMCFLLLGACGVCTIASGQSPQVGDDEVLECGTYAFSLQFAQSEFHEAIRVWRSALPHSRAIRNFVGPPITLEVALGVILYLRDDFSNRTNDLLFALNEGPLTDLALAGAKARQQHEEWLKEWRNTFLKNP
jgi:hypothetical protein